MIIYQLQRWVLEMTNDEIILDIPTDEKPKKFTIMKEFLSQQINIKLKIVVFLFVFIIFNGCLGFLTPYAVGVNMFLLVIAFVVITAIDGFFKHKEK